MISPMASPSLFKIVEKLQITPPLNSPESATQFSLPLTSSDVIFLKFPPSECIYFYELVEPPAYFNSVILPKLKESLSRTLLHFLPLTGYLTWPPGSLPVVLYCPTDAGVSLTIAESSIEGYDRRLYGNGIREASESRLYLPELSISDTKASLVALQVTLFPNKGFCIAISTHHAFLDGRSATMFFKAWAHLCSLLAKDQPHYHDHLPDELVPFFSRDDIHEDDGLKTVIINRWSTVVESDSGNNPRSLKVPSSLRAPPECGSGTFQLTREDIRKIREWVSSRLNKESPDQEDEAKPVSHLSTFVLVCAYTSVCMVKARQGEGERDVFFVYPVDYRSRLDPPLPLNYFGNCIIIKYFVMNATKFEEENGIAMVAKRIGDIINGLQRGPSAEVWEALTRPPPPSDPGTQFISVVGSNRFGFYGSDFGWGRPKAVEITSIDRMGGFSLTEARDENGGVEIGLALTKHEMEAFASLFVNGLKHMP